jgi:hypothetical protein
MMLSSSSALLVEELNRDGLNKKWGPVVMEVCASS